MFARMLRRRRTMTLTPRRLRRRRAGRQCGSLRSRARLNPTFRHCIGTRERLVSERTALINHLRALLLERGIVAAQGRRKLQEALSSFANEGGIEALSPRIRVLIDDLRSEWRGLDERIAAFDAEFIRMARDDAVMRRLTSIPGIGTINATALAAAVGNGHAFRL